MKESKGEKVIIRKDVYLDASFEQCSDVLVRRVQFIQGGIECRINAPRARGVRVVAFGFRGNDGVYTEVAVDAR
jgi:hypothetical protein